MPAAVSLACDQRIAEMRCLQAGLLWASRPYQRRRVELDLCPGSEVVMPLAT